MDSEKNIDKERLDIQRNLAERVYALHRMQNLYPPLKLQKIRTDMEEASIEFVVAGGVAKTGQDALGQPGPRLFLEDGSELSYDLGRILSERLINSSVYR